MACPATACPPARTDAGTSWFRQKRTTAITSATPRHLAINAGRRRTCPFQIWRARVEVRVMWRDQLAGEVRRQRVDACTVDGRHRLLPGVTDTIVPPTAADE